MGNVDIYYSRRTNYAECYYWLRNESTQIDMNKWVLQNLSSGCFYAKEIAPFNTQVNQLNGVFMADKNLITLETDDDVADLTRGCLVMYNGKVWMVDNVQRETHRKQSFLSNEIAYKYYVSVRR